jgi:ferric-dicitrate binding protein FerR (iron transport regulator)
MLKNKEIIIGKYLSGNASPEEVKAVNDWLRENPSNQEEFERMEKLWKVSARLKKDNDHDVDAAWSEFKELAAADKQVVLQKPRFNYYRIAAAVALFIVMGILVKVFIMDSQPEQQVAVKSPAELNPRIDTVEEEYYEYTFDELDTLPVESYSVYSGAQQAHKGKRVRKTKSVAMITITADDSAKIFMLPDNSIVYLNAHSTITYPETFNKSQRRLSLDGEAYFEIAKDSNQFVIACHNTITRGAAVSFNIKGYEKDKNVEVLVVSGNAEFTGMGNKEFKKLSLVAGEKGVLAKDQTTVVKTKISRKDVKWWQSNSLKARIKRFFEKLKTKLNK